MGIANEHVIIVGGSTGIGLATARLMLAEGARVTITGRNAEKLDAACKTLTNEAAGALSTAAFDAADAAQAKAFFERTGAFDHLSCPSAAAVGWDRSAISISAMCVAASMRKYGPTCIARRPRRAPCARTDR